MPEKTKIHLRSSQSQSINTPLDQKSHQHLKTKSGHTSNAIKPVSEASSSKHKRVKDVKSQNAKVKQSNK